MKPDLRSLVLVSNNARIGRPRRHVKGLDEVIKAEQLKTTLFDAFDASPVTKLGRVVGAEGLQSFARELAALHRPAQFDWAAIFGLGSESDVAEVAPPVSERQPTKADAPRRGSGHRCASCGVPVSFAVVKFCWSDRARFGDAIYCMDCQPKFPRAPRQRTPASPSR